MGRRPGGFPRAELAQHRAGGVIYHVHETAVGGAIFQPGMKAGIQLHQFAEMRLAHPALAIRLSRSLAAPKSGRFHPAPQGLGGHLQSVFFLQVFRRQRRPEVRITPAYLNEHRLAKLLGVSSVRDPPAVAMLQGFRAPTAIPRPHPLGLPIAQPQQLRRLLQPQDRKSTRLNSSHGYISYAVFCLKKKKNKYTTITQSSAIHHTTNPLVYYTAPSSPSIQLFFF